MSLKGAQSRLRDPHLCSPTGLYSSSPVDNNFQEN